MATSITLDRVRAGAAGTFRLRRYGILTGWLIAVTIGMPLAFAPSAYARASNGLIVVIDGLPPNARPAVTIRGPAFRRSIVTSHASVAHIRPGRYVIEVRRVRLAGAYRRIRRGAVAFPMQTRLYVRVRVRRTARVVVKYGSIVNPSARPLPTRVIGVLGNPSNPTGVLLTRGSRAPLVGTIFTSGPRPNLPAGLVSRVTRVTRQGSLLVVF